MQLAASLRAAVFSLVASDPGEEAAAALQSLERIYTQWMRGILSDQILAGLRQLLGELRAVLRPSSACDAAGGGRSDEAVADLAEGLQKVLGSADGGLGEQMEALAEIPSIDR
jgi:hypothetical protein